MKTVPGNRQRGVSPRVRRHASLVALGVLLLVLAAGGGASRVNVASLMLIRPLLAIAVAGLLFLPIRAGNAEGGRGPGILLAVFALTMVLQLVPLPPAIWQHLPGHAGYADAATLAGLPQPWRPVSVVPILTLNSLLSLLAPLALFMAGRRVAPADYDSVLAAMMVLAFVSCLVGVIQIVGGDRSPAYLYDYARPGFAPGLLANRNHQAAFLAAMLPMTTAWALGGSTSLGSAVRRRWAATLLAVLFLVVIVMTSSRSGFGLAILGLIGAAWLIFRQSSATGRHWKSAARLGREPTRKEMPRWMVGAAIALAGLIVVLLPLLAGRAAVFDRLLNSDADASAMLRLAALPITLDLAWTFLPFGSGFGTFDPVFRAVEPDRLLAPGYFNNAHNDLIELAITGGIPAVLVILAYIVWLAARTRRAISIAQGSDRQGIVVLASAMFLAIMLLASLSDYPLRTPLLAGLFGLVTALVASIGYRKPEKLVDDHRIHEEIGR